MTELSGYMLDRVSNLFILGLLPVTIITGMIDLFQHKYEVLRQLEFLKLMIYSVYCGFGVISSWNTFNWLYFVDETIWDPSS